MRTEKRKMLSTKVLIDNGPVGNIEAVIEAPSSKKKLVGIICHPHPLHGGTMSNKVVTTVVRAFQRLDIVPIRFNFRGVGQSEGKHDYSHGEQDDLKSVISWARQNFEDYQLILAGFSFGAFIAAKVASEIPPKALITIAPAVNHSPYENLPAFDFPWIVVQGEADEVVPASTVFDWLAKLHPQPITIRMPGVSHFFHGHLIELRDSLIEKLAPIIDPRA